jgi:hypothetical protein
MVKPLDFSMPDNKTLRVEGYPDAVALKRIDDPIARQLQGMVLHQTDLGFCKAALDELGRINRLAQPVLSEALWVSAITRYFKCFGKNAARTQLTATKVLKGHPLQAHEVFKYFKDLRDKHIVHDENPYSQSFVGVALNAEGASFKVADIISLAVSVFTFDDEHFGSFRNLVEVTLAHVSTKRDELHNLLGKLFSLRAACSVANACTNGAMSTPSLLQ